MHISTNKWVFDIFETVNMVILNPGLFCFTLFCILDTKIFRFHTVHLTGLLLLIQSKTKAGSIPILKNRYRYLNPKN